MKQRGIGTQTHGDWPLRFSLQRSFGVIMMICILTHAFSTSGLCVQIIDDESRTVSLAAPAKRIISLYGAFSEMLFAIGAGPQLVARTQADQYPADLSVLPSIGTHMHPNVEMILGLKPDLVLQSTSRREAIAEMDRLNEAGICIAVFGPNSFDQVFSTMERLGALTGHEDEAKSKVADLRKRLETVKGRLSGIERPSRVFFEVRAEPLAGAGQGSMVQAILSSAGAENILQHQKPIVRYSLESLLFENPDVYIVQQGPMNRNPLNPAERPHFNQLKSVREGKVLLVDEFIYSRPGPRCVDAVEELAGTLYPDRFKGDKAK